jgi:hypothetical protein
VALIPEGEEVTSRPDAYKVAGTDASTRLYACPNIASKVSIVHADRNTPGFMRSPPEVPYLFALASAMDELAVALNMDPVALRRRNDTMREPIRGLPYTSRSLIPCFDAAAKAFGRERRTAQPGSMRDGDWLVGWGPGQRSRHQGARRIGQCRHQRGGRERGVSRDRRQDPRAADPARKTARRAGDRSVTGADSRAIRFPIRSHAIPAERGTRHPIDRFTPIWNRISYRC